MMSPWLKCAAAALSTDIGAAGVHVARSAISLSQLFVAVMLELMTPPQIKTVCPVISVL